MWNMLTVDGSAGGRSEVVDRLRAWGEELLPVSLEQARTVDALLLGRTSYELLSEYWSSAAGDVADLVNATPKIVFSRTLKRAAWSNTRLVTADPVSEVARLKRQPGRDLLLLGRSALSSLLLERGLVDEWRLAVTPIVPGASNPRRDPGARQRRIALLETRRLSSGCLVMRYGQMGRFGSPRLTGAKRVITPAALAVPDRPTSVVDGPFIETKEWPLGSIVPRE
jgi:dihydrofolate reductase